ncbi:MAG: ABC transporter permease [Clostridiaceae bacterium]|jgi:osmoprotectant transport system permease protein|nr:ABC transporter permease [Clostridiales bacterium]MDD2572828.1 ABC transporter permease [Eubacteriales bacterium]MDD4186690.1 ABC transporter permease [Eubacteriales bacterium]NLG30627.1 ABC transporter permease [Clostridiaceae bacterium]
MNTKILLEHLYLVLMSVVLSIAVGLPLGITAYLYKPFRRPLLRVTELLQTIPALALLGMVMLVIGAGKTTVIIGLLLYSLLPIVHNSYIGLAQIDPAIKRAARGMGMSKFDRLFAVELPLAFPLIFTGIRIATVTSVGIAVFATSVGGGGLGTLINQGIRTQNIQKILSGTLSLMAMAVIFDAVMAWIEKRLNKRKSA